MVGRASRRPPGACWRRRGLTRRGRMLEGTAASCYLDGSRHPAEDRRMRLLRAPAVLAAVLLAFGALVGDDPRPAPKPPDLPPHFRKLGLTNEQVAAIGKIRDAADAKVKELEEKIQAARDEEAAAVEKVLTDAQRA